MVQDVATYLLHSPFVASGLTGLDKTTTIGAKILNSLGNTWKHRGFRVDGSDPTMS